VTGYGSRSGRFGRGIGRLEADPAESAGRVGQREGLAQRSHKSGRVEPLWPGTCFDRYWFLVAG